MGCDEQHVSGGGEESWWHQRQPCPVCPPQGSQPSTASPFKQDVFVYGASPGSESPSVAAAATPVIMSRSPTGGSRGAGEAPALPSPLEAPRVPQRWVRMGSVALGWRSAPESPVPTGLLWRGGLVCLFLYFCGSLFPCHLRGGFCCGFVPCARAWQTWAAVGETRCLHGPAVTHKSFNKPAASLGLGSITRLLTHSATDPVHCSQTICKVRCN